MWTLWVIPSLLLLLGAGAAAAAIWYWSRPAGRRPGPFALAAVPLGCVVLPFIALALLSGAASLFQKSDAQLFEEVFGYASPLREDQMLFDDFGRESGRAIFMRAEALGGARQRLLSVPGLTPSTQTPAQFEARGAQHGFSWWLSNESFNPDRCKRARVFEADGFRGWSEFRIAECLEGGDDMWADIATRYVYVVASRRP